MAQMFFETPLITTIPTTPRIYYVGILGLNLPSVLGTMTRIQARSAWPQANRGVNDEMRVSSAGTFDN
jgi:hypothetical protein